MKKRMIALLMAAVLGVFSFTACTGGAASTAASTASGSAASASASTNLVPATGTSDETLNVASDGEPNSIFPNYATNKSCNRVDSCMFDTLVRWDDTNKKAVPCLATSWNWDDDTHITFTLRDDVTFTNGEKMTANDVLVSLQASCDNTLSNYTGMFDMANSKAIDDTHVQIALTRPYSNLVDILGCTYYAIFSSKAYADVNNDAETFSHNPVGSGPYKLQNWKQGESITLVRNDDYWDKDNLPYYKTIVFTFIADGDSRVTALQSGSVQLAFNLAPSQVETLKSDSNLTVNPYLQNVAMPLAFNMKSFPVLQDENVRKAILLATDKNAIAQARYQGYSKVSNSSLLSTLSPYYTETDPTAPDVETAKKLIADSGHTSEELTFTMGNITGESTAYLEIFQAEMAEIGVTINIETLDLPSFLQKMWANGYGVCFGETDTWDVNRMLDVIDSRVTTPTGNNAYVGDGEDDLHALIDKSEGATTDDDRAAALKDIQQFCTDHAVCTSICDIMFVDAWNSNLTGVTYDAHCWPNIWNVRPLVAAQ